MSVAIGCHRAAERHSNGSVLLMRPLPAPARPPCDALFKRGSSPGASTWPGRLGIQQMIVIE